MMLLPKNLIQIHSSNSHEHEKSWEQRLEQHCERVGVILLFQWIADQFVVAVVVA